MSKWREKEELGSMTRNVCDGARAKKRALKDGEFAVVEQTKLTLDGVLRVKIIRHAHDALVQRLDLADHALQILQHQLSRVTGKLAAELIDIVTHTAADIHEEFPAAQCRVEAGEKPLLDGEEPGVHPARPALAVSAHDVVEARPVGRVGLEVREEVGRPDAVGLLVVAVRRAGRVSVRGGLEVTWQVGQSGVDAEEAVSRGSERVVITLCS